MLVLFCGVSFANIVFLSDELVVLICIVLSIDVYMTNYLFTLIVVEFLLYAPVRPVVDISVIFLWLMAVGTVACASLWSEFTAMEKSEGSYSELSPKVSTMLPMVLSSLFLTGFPWFVIKCIFAFI